MSARVYMIIALGCLAALAPTSVGCAQDADSLRMRADTALNTGRYDDARSLYERTLETSPFDQSAVHYAQTFVEVGRYEDGLAAIDRLLQNAPQDPSLLQARGRLLTAVGRYDEAGRALATALDQNTELWSAALDMAELLARTGQERQARSLFAYLYRQYETGTFRTAPELMVAGRAAAALEQFRDANQAFRTAHQIDAGYVPNLHAWATLFRQNFNDADARRTYEEALAVNPTHASSLVGLARAGSDFERQEELAQQALAVNPNLTDALDLLANLRLLDGMYGEAEATARRALEVNPNSVPSMAQLASVHHLRGDTSAFRQIEQRALAVDPQASYFYLAVAENLTRRFRYPDAAVAAERAVQVDPSDASARAELGTALLRLGRRSEARRHLEAAFERDPYNLFAANTLTLLDTYEEFDLLESPHFRLLIHSDERDVLGPIVLEMAETAYDSLQARYPYEPQEKILIEAYNEADDFAVRIAGVPHRGLLGVSFGDVVAVNTPRAQTGQAYNWARTLWHELAHTMAIGVSDFHVPRWYTEGLSVYEEQRARPEWGREMELAFLSAYEHDRLLPLEDIDRGFTRPSYPGQVILSYYHAGEIIEFIADEYGFAAVIDILQGFARGTGLDASVTSATGLSVAALDERFRDRVQQRRRELAQVVQGLPDMLSSEDAHVSEESAADAGGPLFSQLRSGAESLARNDFQSAESAFQAAIDVYPEYVGPMNAYEGLATVYRSREDAAALEDVLVRYLRIAEHETDAALELADMYEERGDLPRAAAMFERSLHVAPYDAEVHDRLAHIYEDSERYESAVSHRRAVLALNPTDRAAAYYRLARSLLGSRDIAEARRAVLQSLEIAPGFRDAQKLLLEVAR